MPGVLRLWLGADIPPFTEKLSQFILLFSILYQYSNGIMSSIQATGNIRNYQKTMGLIILTNIPITYVVLKRGYPIYYVTATFVFVEFISLVVRVFMARKIVGMRITDYLINVVKPTLIIVGGATVVALIPHLMMTSCIERLLLVCAIYLMSFAILSWFFAFESKRQRNDIILEIKENFIKIYN